LNDSKKKLGSRIDRHEHIGQGFIGLKAFALFMNDKKLSDIPKIIETPDGKGFQDWDRFNIEKLRTLTHTNPKDPLL
jgi:deoxyribonuclease-4